MKTLIYEKTSGALLSDNKIEGLTQPLQPNSGYGAMFFIAETMSLSCAKKITALLGMKLSVVR